MIKKLIQYENSVTLVIDKPILEMLNITNETPFELSTDGKNIILFIFLLHFTNFIFYQFN